jgi:hypothetical protein
VLIGAHAAGDAVHYDSDFVNFGHEIQILDFRF